LARRFLGSLWPAGPGDQDEAWARSCLTPGEQSLWAQMSGPDRRHAVAVARRVAANDHASVPAALLHDIGKVASRLGPVRRAGVTALAVAAGRERVARGRGRMARYLRHDSIGAELLQGVGSDGLTVSWAREHHLPPDRWTVPTAVGAALKAADDD
jgi:HD-like signal output (HDOD) protein